MSFGPAAYRLTRGPAGRGAGEPTACAGEAGRGSAWVNVTGLELPQGELGYLVAWMAACAGLCHADGQRSGGQPGKGLCDFTHPRPLRYARRIGEPAALTTPSPPTNTSSRSAVFTQGHNLVFGMREMPAQGVSTTDSGAAELIAPGLRIGLPSRRPGTPHPRVRAGALEVITPKAACPELVNRMATGPTGKR